MTPSRDEREALVKREMPEIWLGLRLTTDGKFSHCTVKYSKWELEQAGYHAPEIHRLAIAALTAQPSAGEPVATHATETTPEFQRHATDTAAPSNPVADRGEAAIVQKCMDVCGLVADAAKKSGCTEQAHGALDCQANIGIHLAHALSAPTESSPETVVVPIELAGVAEQLKEGGGFWTTCSGCHETVDGHEVAPYQFSKILNCTIGGGCGECGGIGAIWDTTDYEDMARSIMAEDAAASPGAQKGEL